MGQQVRARQPEQKEERRRAILSAARGLLAERPWDQLRMAAVAGRLGLAKGTLYLYFPTKEALFLAVLREELDAWFGEAAAALRPPRRGDPARALARALAGTIAARPLLRRLLALLHGVLEGNLPLAAIRAFKRALLAQVVDGGARLEAALPGLRRGHGALALLRLHALVIGVQSMTDASPVARQALRDPALALFDLAFEPTLAGALADLLAGMQRDPR
jgi:AcrR family transcriptional regulator